MQWDSQLGKIRQDGIGTAAARSTATIHGGMTAIQVGAEVKRHADRQVSVPEGSLVAMLSP